ncbi:MAG: hypothetical protein JRG96_19700 [Deltaproteobacteria bacterium]|nr:hypothetical protein [Deltaproteobacteria bacterium]
MQFVNRLSSIAAVLLLAVVAAGTAAADAAKPAPHNMKEDHGDLAAIGEKLNDPTSNVWAMFTQFSMTLSSGDYNLDGAEPAGQVSFQPILPVPLHGEGKDQWKLLVRPTIPIVFSQPIPTGTGPADLDEFRYSTGLGDMLLPLAVTPAPSITKKWIFGLGPAFSFPTATLKDLGTGQLGIGPALILGYKSEKWTAVTFPQYFFGVADTGSRGANDPTMSQMTWLYSFWYNLPDAWFIGFNPSISFNAKADDGNKWNVPVSFAAAKVVAINKRPWKFQFGIEYSVVSEDDFGKRFLFKINAIPVIQGLIQNPIFGK